SITKRLVSAMGGVLEVKSELGKGSVFKVVLDLQREQNLAQDPTSAEAAIAVPVKASTPGLQQHFVDPEFASELYDLAMKGDVKELLARTQSAAACDPRAASTYEEIQRLARNFDMKGVRQALRRSNGA